MKNWISISLAVACLTPITLQAQKIELSDAWADPQFVKQFAGSFLPLTDQEPTINEDEGLLFQELGELLANDQVALAIEKLTAAVQKTDEEEPASAALNYTLGNIHIQQGNSELALQQYQVAIKKFPTFRRAFKNLGLALIQNGRYEEAIANIVKAIELGDSAGDTFGLLAYSYLNVGNSAAALEGYRQASLLNPANKEWQIGKAEALMRTERYQEAIAEFKSLIEENPERSAFYTSIANAYIALEDSVTAAVYLEILKRQGEATASALGLLGDIYINEGLPALAVAAYISALESNSYSNNRSIRTLQAFLQRQNYDEADAFLSRFLSLRSDRLDEEENLELLNIQAQLALGRGQDDDAAEILEKVLESDPVNGNALMLLGGYNHDKGDIEEAIFYYERAVQISSTQRNAQLQLARIYVQQKEYRDAIRQLEAALSIQYSSNVQDFLDAVKTVYNRSI
ncbi:MAG: tetratricopeptide repeat protein [Puniceicoccaceae bacterium]